MIPTDSFLHAHRKILSETLSTTTTTPTSPPTTTSSPQSQPPPPAYTPTTQLPTPTNQNQPTTTTLPTTLTYDPYSSEDFPSPSPPPITIKIDASTKIVGHGNYISSSIVDSQYVKSEKIVAGILERLKESGVFFACDGDGDGEGEGMGSGREVDVSLNCGVSVVGCRNVVGGAGLMGKKEEMGRKRKVEDDDGSEEPKSKKVNVEAEA
ncbi:MAG: hypothetical protein M1812_001716 [Candelaria pacifica]|nr:MAG: hypothetical protein M1812_001716 [Candelaria pacifica]